MEKNWSIIIFLFINVMSLCYADAIFDSEPDPTNRVARAAGRDQCCNDCWYDGNMYKNGISLTQECVEVQCRYGEWFFIGTNLNCSFCHVYGEPHIQPFNSPWSYHYSGLGHHVLSQYWLSIPSVFGVSSYFYECEIMPFNGGTYHLSCVGSITYYERSIEIEVNLAPMGGPYTIQVIQRFNSRRTVLVFEYSPWKGTTCVIIVGTEGISVIVCQHGMDPAFVYVLAMPSLRNQLYGLCDVFIPIEDNLNNYTMANGSTTADTDIFAPTWKIDDGPPSDYTPPIIDRCTNATVVSEIEDTCNSITSGVCEISEQQCGDFNQSCQFDLCAVPDYESFVEGYTSHMRFHSDIILLS